MRCAIYHYIRVAGIILFCAAALAAAVIPLTRTHVPRRQTDIRTTFPRAASSSTSEGQAPGRRPVSFYVSRVRPSLFAAPQPPTLPLAPVVSPVRIAHEEPLTAPLVDSLPPPPDRFAAYVYSGSVTMAGQMQALLEDATTKEGWYVKVGETFQGELVTDINRDRVIVMVDGQPREFVKSSAFNVTPLTVREQAAPQQTLTNTGVFTTGTFVHF